MATRTQTYWINRSNQRMDRYILDAERQADLISQSYYQASRYIEEEMAKTIKNLAVLSDDRTAIAALKRSPSKSLLRQLRSAVNTMAPGPEKDKALTLLASPSYQLRLRQLQTTIDNARRECERMYQMELNSTTEHLRNLYDDAFLHSVYDIDKGYNALHTFSMYPASRVDKLLKMPWSGAHYSDRIWGRTQNLADELRTQLITAFMTGATISETSAAIRERFAYASAYQARRLIRTETNYIANQAELDSYKRLGIEEYKYIATLDTRTSRLCQELDGQVFNSDDATAGKNFPPMHPNCRSTTIMYDAEEPLKERTARDENGNRITVPGNMKYKEWLEKYHPELAKNNLISSRYSDKIESELGNFKNKIKSNPEIKKDYYDMVKTRFSHMPESAKRVYNKYVKIDSVYGSFEGTPHYESGKIYMHFGSDLNNERGNGATWFHEHGHMIDELSGGTSTKNPLFYETLRLDYSDYISKVRRKHPEMSLKSIQSLISSELNDYRQHSAVSDMFHGLSNERIKGCSSHKRRLDGTSYWTEEAISQEAFAHMFECQSDDVRYKEMKKYFPKSLELFEKMLEVM